MSTKANGKYHKAVDLSSVDFTDSYDYLYIQTGGNIVTVDNDGTELTVTRPDDHYFLCGGRQVTKTGTTATGITAYKYSQPF